MPKVGNKAIKSFCDLVLGKNHLCLKISPGGPLLSEMREDFSNQHSFVASDGNPRIEIL